MRDASDVHVESIGAGPSLVLLHGFAMHSGLFAPLLPALSANHRVHLVDLPGHGRSPPFPSYTVDTLVDAVHRAIDGEVPVDVLGWSLGGAVALAWGAKHPARVRRIVAVATTPAFVARSGWPHAMLAETLSRFGDELRVAYEATLKRFLTLQVQGSEEGRATLAAMRAQLFERGRPSPDALEGTLRLLDQLDLRDDVARVRQAVRVVSGDRDTLVPLGAGTWLANALPHGSLSVIAGAGHAPFLSHAREFLAAAQPFLDAR